MDFMTDIGPCTGTSKKVLIVDDEYLIRWGMQKMVEQEGYLAFTAACGYDALHLFSEQKPDIVILDFHLPDLNGLALLKMIKDIRPSVTAIMATGCPDEQNSLEAMKMGALAYLEKPVSIHTLRSMMHSSKQAGAIQNQEIQ